MGKLEGIRKAFEQECPAFPYGYCSEAARVISKLIGLEEIAGTRVNFVQFHACNYDPANQMYVDITADQFSFNTGQKILIHPEDPALFQPRADYTELQRNQNSKPMRKLVARVIKRVRSMEAAMHHLVLD
jgi:hypothetical protein